MVNGETRVREVLVDVALDRQDQRAPLGGYGTVVTVCGRPKAASDEIGCCYRDPGPILWAQRACGFMDCPQVGSQEVAETCPAGEHETVKPVRVLEQWLQCWARQHQAQILEAFSPGVQCPGQIKDADISWLNTDRSPVGLANITTHGIILDEVVIDTAASNSHGRTAEFLRVRSDAPEKEWSEMVAFDFDLEISHSLSIA
jgi:hypothetical protein